MTKQQQSFTAIYVNPGDIVILRSKPFLENFKVLGVNKSYISSEPDKLAMQSITDPEDLFWTSGIDVSGIVNRCGNPQPVNVYRMACTMFYKRLTFTNGKVSGWLSDIVGYYLGNLYTGIPTVIHRQRVINLYTRQWRGVRGSAVWDLGKPDICVQVSRKRMKAWVRANQTRLYYTRRELEASAHESIKKTVC